MAKMKIGQLYIYPIKSLRPTVVTEATLTRHGVLYDRSFMLLKVEPDKLANMHVSVYQKMTLFQTNIIFPSTEDANDGKVIVTYRAPIGHVDRDVVKMLEIPLDPSIAGLKGLDIDMHSSATKAYAMGSEYNSWFSECFGFEVILAFLGENRRPVLGNLPPNVSRPTQGGSTGWLSNITKIIPYIGSNTGANNASENITFSDMAPYLVVSETSLNNVSNRLPDGMQMDITKFRPNIVVSGAETDFEEDFWAELVIKDDLKMILTANCARCLSINIDFDTGTQGTDELGSVLKKLMKDRRVDKGAKYNPIFGRYAFLDTQAENTKVRIGDEVQVTKRNEEHTVFDWPN